MASLPTPQAWLYLGGSCGSARARRESSGRYPPASGFTLPVGLALPTGNLEETGPYLRPTYLRSVPPRDGWNSWFGYGTTTAMTDYVLRSAGQKGEAESAPLYGPTTDLTADIILVNGQFVQWPEGVQQ